MFDDKKELVVIFFAGLGTWERESCDFCGKKDCMICMDMSEFY